jgi:ankyrin repeat protein
MGADIDAVDMGGSTPLMLAAQIAEERIARVLIDRGAKLDMVDQNGLNAMHMAASHGLTSMVELLGRAGLSVCAVTGDGWTVLHYASSSARRAEDTVKYLLDAGADISPTDSVGQTPLHTAIRANNTNAARVLIAAGAPLNVADYGFKTPLQYAVDNENIYSIQDLLEKLQKQGDLCTPNQLIKWFPKQHVDGTTTYWNAGSVLHDAVANGQEQIAELLLSNQRDIHFQDLYGRTALDWTPALNPKLRHKILRHWGTYPQDLDPRQQTEILKRSVTTLANNILLSLSMPTQRKTVYQHYLYTLGKCLLYLDDEDNARSAFALQGAPRDRDSAKYEGVTCKRCRRCPTVEGGRWVCKSCPRVDLCYVCAWHYAEFCAVGMACVAHQMLEVRAVNQDGLEIGEDGELIVGKEWLEGLITLYST